MNVLMKRLESVKFVNDNDEILYEIDRLDKEDLIESLVEVKLKEPDDFLKIKETLTRVGIGNRAKKELYASCLILHKKGKYYITHFKEMFAMDGRETEMYLDDYQRRNHIVKLLESWGLLEIVNVEMMKNIPNSEQIINVYILPFKEKKEWKTIQKYAIGEMKEVGKNGNK